MTTSPMRRVLLVVGALAFVAGACGGDDDTAPALAGIERTDDDAPSDADATEQDEAAADEPADGSDEEPATDEPSKADDALAQMLAAELLDEPDSPVQTEEEANCMSAYIVDEIGTGRLLELGISADDDAGIEDMDFSEAEIGTIVASMFECVDIQARLTEELAADFGQEDAECLAQGLDADTLTIMMTAMFQGASESEMPVEFLETFFELMVECGIEFE